MNNDNGITPHEETNPPAEAVSAVKTHLTRGGKIASLLRGTLVALIAVALMTLTAFSLWLTAFRVESADMDPAIGKGELVVAVKMDTYQRNDIIAFYYNNDVMIKRVVAVAGDEVAIDPNGTLYINGIGVDEPYVVNPGLGECEITFPYKIPEGRVFALGDNRASSKDSRLEKIGAVSDMLILGKVMFGIWPLNSIGLIE